MSGRILIIDAVATNRITLKVKLLASHYDVTAVANQHQAEAVLSGERPDLIIIDLADRREDRHAFCRKLQADISTNDIPILGIGIADTIMARFAALDAGLRDIIPFPVNETLLLARIRSLLRIRHVQTESWIKDSEGRALGFEEEPTGFAQPARVTILTDDRIKSADLIRQINKIHAPNVTILPLDRHLPTGEPEICPDLYVIDATTMAHPQQDLFRIAADLRSRRETHLASQLIMVPRNDHLLAAQALDLGADDVALTDATNRELAIRSHLLLTQKQTRDRLRTILQDRVTAAEIDPLTGLHNRRYVAPYLSGLATQAQQAGQEFALMMIDVDHFKRINDTYGHVAGDDVLVELAKRLRSNLRSFDLVARIGGEEFLVALPVSSADQAAIAADRLRKLITDQPFKVGDATTTLAVTVSIGVALAGDEEEPAHVTKGMWTQADGALYAAKMAGRNQISMAAPAA